MTGRVPSGTSIRGQLLSRRYWISTLLAGVLLLGGMALVALTLGVGGSAGLRPDNGGARPLCRSCQIYTRISETFAPLIDKAALAALKAGLAPWRVACEEEGRQCNALFAPVASSDRCNAITRQWTALEDHFAARLREVSKISVSCSALSCPVLPCDDAQGIVDQLARSDEAIRLFMLLGVAPQTSSPRVFAKAIALLSDGRDSISHLADNFAALPSNFGTEWAIWQKLAGAFENVGDDLLGQAALTREGHDLFYAAAGGARAVASSLERLGGGDRTVAAWSDFGSALGRFLLASARIDEVIAHSVSGPSFEACGADIADRARRLDAASSQIATDFALCHARAQCLSKADAKEARGTFLSRPAAPLSTLEQAVSDLKTQTVTTQVTDSPAANLRLAYAFYSPREPMALGVEAAGNQCLAAGATIELRPLTPAADVPTVRTHVPSADQSVTLAAPDVPGDYLALLLPPRTVPTPQIMVPLAQTPFKVVPAPPGCSGFAGTWDTDFGEMTAVVRGETLLGTYRRAGASRPGVVEGTVKGREMTGTWRSDLGRGGVHLVLQGDGQRFSGTWGSKPEEVDGSGLWRGRCMPSGPTP